jgi:hypothetical protein
MSHSSATGFLDCPKYVAEGFLCRNTVYSWLAKWLQTELCVPNFQHMTDADIVSTIAKSEDEVEEKNSVHINHSA